MSMQAPFKYRKWKIPCQMDSDAFVKIITQKLLFLKKIKFRCYVTEILVLLNKDKTSKLRRS